MSLSTDQALNTENTASTSAPVIAGTVTPVSNEKAAAKYKIVVPQFIEIETDENGNSTNAKPKVYTRGQDISGLKAEQVKKFLEAGFIAEA